LTIVANGVERSRVASTNGMMRTQYEIAAPIPTYLMVVAAARMVATPVVKTCAPRTAAVCVPQSVYTFPNERTYAPGPFAEAAKIVEFFARTVGPFPYEQLNHLQSATRFGGMENATAIFYSDNAFKNRNVGLQLIAHETVHQWFGDAVTPRRWQDLWLSEGFASYFAPLYLRHSEGDSAFRAAMRRIRDQIVADEVVATRPVVDTVGAKTPLTLLNANSYQKGAFVLHMLRARLPRTTCGWHSRNVRALPWFHSLSSGCIARVTPTSPCSGVGSPPPVS
jgi:aminopeptidase N